MYFTVRKTMKRSLLPFLLIVCMQSAFAQNNLWFKGTWYGAESFATAHIGIKVPVRVEIDSVDNQHFSGRYIYMYPEDTSARLIRTFSGDLTGVTIKINKATELYLRDPRTRSFWSDCSSCEEKGRFSLTDTTYVLTITIDNCDESCNGQTVITRKLNQVNVATAERIKKLIRETDIVVINTNKKTKNAKQKTIAASATNKTLNKRITDTVATNTAHSINQTNSDSLKQLSKNSNDTSQIKTLSSTQHPVDSIASIQTSASVNNASIQNKTNNNTNPADSNTANTLNKPMPDTAVQARVHRTTDLVNTFQITESHVKVELFDNGEVDSDAVSVYYNGRIIINNQVLTTKAITFYVDASPTNRHLELTLIAENEGSIPPNSALMRITAGDKQFEIFISTSMTKNAKIALDYIGD